MNFKIQLFATLKASLGHSYVEIDIAASSTIADLVDQLADQYPSISPMLRVSLVAVNREFAAADQILLPGDEIAIFPAVSGGLF
jgi:molybdopterin converting factor small subunit